MSPKSLYHVSISIGRLSLLCALGCASLLFGAETASEAPDKEPKESEELKVSTPPGPTTEAEIDVSEGTWMNVDVSPDGKEIVFDLLGDLYLLPIEGGEAKPLTSGLEWDMQPRFSPDGHSVAFTSDRGGGDNIWILDRETSETRALTKEDFRLLNSPAWSPDGEYVAARKHFTSHRSLGAGEIWLYHRSGGKGLQLTKRPNDQKDLGEPEFSPDGRHVYFSQDVTPGNTFDYNKDSNAGIYAIKRLDRETGDVEVVTGGPGGAIRPTASPDGEYLAFVRRVRFQSTLFVRHLASGAEWPIYDELDRDMQETWAIHGVYPTMAWTPDGKSLVFWAGGRLRSMVVASGETRVIPFHIRDTREVVDALRFPIEAAPEEFDVKMLRWVEVSPKGDRVVYQALGRLYIRELPDGQPRRLTTQTNHFEFFPSFSRDGASIVYTTWDDEEFGAVRVAPSDGGSGRVLTQAPGHYVEPAFSPDGETVVYRKIGGHNLRGHLWTSDPGLYAAAASGEPTAPVRVSREGVRPHFGKSSDRVFYFVSEGDDRRALRSVELDGSDERVHFQADNATEFKVSPDEQWIAFRIRFDAFVAPFARTGQPVELSAKTEALPVAHVSADAGEYLHWSGDSRRLYWALGPELFHRDLNEAFAFLEGAPEELPGPPDEGLNIGFQAKSDRPEGTIALIGARVITMSGDEIIEDGVVVVKGNRVSAVGPRSLGGVPDDARIIDVSGKTIIPGLIDVHAHGPQGANEMTVAQNWLHYSMLAFGVTTTHDPSNDTSTIFAASELGRSGLITAPRIYSTGTILYGAAGDAKAEINSLEDAERHLRRMKAVGAFSVKSYNQPRRDQRQHVIRAARELEMMVAPEGGSLLQHNLTMIVDGHTGIEHSIPVARVYDDVLQLWGASETYYTPTLVVAYGGIWGENYWYQHTDVWRNERLLTFVPRRLVDARSRRRVMAPEEEYNHFSNAKICKELVDRGVHVQLGAHGQREGLAAHWELWMFVQGGMSPLEALRAGTLHGAAYLGLDGDLGSIEPGKLADLAVLDRNPLESIRNSESVRFVMVNGRLFDAAAMNEIAPREQERQPFWWERDPASRFAPAESRSDDER